MDWGIVGTITGIVSLALIVFAGGRYIGKLDALARRHEDCPVMSVKEEVAVLRARFDMLIKVIEQYVPKSLVAPHTPRRDELLHRLSIQEITLPESQELLDDMERNMQEFKGEKFLAAILLVVRLKDKLNGWS